MKQLQIKEMLVPLDKLAGAKRQRKTPYVFENIRPELREAYESEDWELDRVLKRSIKMRRPKTPDVGFEDRIWTMFATLGFNDLNLDRNFKLPYGSESGEEQQIDVFAADTETVLVVECKVAIGDRKTRTFKKEAEAIAGMREGLLRSIKTGYPHHKVKFILATSGYSVLEKAKRRLADFEIAHFDEDTVEYYTELSKHLGPATRFQLLGSLFAGQKIPGIDNEVPAIRGKLGGNTYFSFSIEPEKLLKIGFILHRHHANNDLIPNYQRLIKRSRLRNVRDFVDSGGFFPNSVIINLESGKKGPKFDLSPMQVDSTDARLGTLHLPQNYRSAYVIDGQHRLYGYADSDRASTDSVPVVAFVNLPKREQVRLFMQINENQKAVPKNLRNTLNADLLWDSEDLREQNRALKLRISQHLGENRDSPLYDRVIIGENVRTQLRCITIDAITIGLDRGNLFGTFTKTATAEEGTFYRGSNQQTFDAVVPYLEGCFSHLRVFLPGQFEIGSGEDGFVFINAGIESIIRVISDIVDHLVVTGSVKPKSDDPEDVVHATLPYLDPIITYLDGLSQDERSELRRGYGTGGRVRYWRTLQRAVNESRPDFQPEGLEKYWRDEAKAFNTESFEMIRELEMFMKDDFRERLQSKYGSRWLKDGIPVKVHRDAAARALEKNRMKDEADEVDAWDCLYIINYRDITTYDHAVWLELFEKRYTKPGDERKKGGWKAKTEWMIKLSDIRNENTHTYSVKEEEYVFLGELTEWLIEDKVDNAVE